MGRLQVLCATVGQEDFSLVRAMNIRTDVIFANQNGRNETREADFGAFRARIISTDTRGVGINRNLALMHSSGELCLLADDDVRYVDGYEAIVTQAFDANPQADVLIFNLYDDSSWAIPRRTRVRWYNFMRFGACRVAVRGAAVRRQGIFFNTCFGGGCLYQSGEDTLFLRDCLRSGLKIYGLPVYIAAMKYERPSTWFRGYDEKFFYDKGAVCAAISRPFARLLCLRLLLVKKQMRRETGLSFRMAWRLMLAGIRGYKDGQGFENRSLV